MKKIYEAPLAEFIEIEDVILTSLECEDKTSDLDPFED